MDASPLINRIVPNISRLIDEGTKISTFITFSKEWNTNILPLYLPIEIVENISYFNTNNLKY